MYIHVCASAFEYLTTWLHCHACVCASPNMLTYIILIYSHTYCTLWATHSKVKGLVYYNAQYCNVTVNSLIHSHTLSSSCRNPDYHQRVSFNTLTAQLSESPTFLLAWTKEDEASAPQASVLGAPLEEAAHLYQDLQKLYNGT